MYRHSVLKEFDLSGCRIHDEGATKIAEYMKANETLEQLFLSFNHISTPGAVAIGEAATELKSLKLLDMGGNGLDRAGTFPLREAMRKNDSMCTLSQNLMKHPIDGSGVVATITRTML
jgi:Ran GTPase-activating protein (RanGAP) involved in mRNA processing and transport